MLRPLAAGLSPFPNAQSHTLLLYMLGAWPCDPEALGLSCTPAGLLHVCSRPRTSSVAKLTDPRDSRQEGTKLGGALLRSEESARGVGVLKHRWLSCQDRAIYSSVSE